MSNNSPKEFGFYEAKENIPNREIKILSILDDVIRPFHVTVKFLGDLTMISFQEKKTMVQGELLRVITLDIFTKPKSYSLNLYHQTKDSKNQEHVYKIKVKGDYELKTLKTNLEKLIRGKNLTHRPRFYPL